MTGSRIDILTEIDLHDFGEIHVHPGDVDGDGRLELVFAQGQDHAGPAPSTGFYPHEKVIWCVTAIDLEGNVLWQHGRPRPDADPNRKYHGRGPVVVHDLDGDGSAEVVYVTAPTCGDCRLRLLHGTDGSLVREVRTWASYSLFPADLRGLERKGDLVLGNALWLVFTYTQDLEPMLRWHRFYGGGHRHAAADVTGQGRDDLFIGLGRYDADGRRIWWRPDLDDALEQMPCCPHMDKVEVRRFFADRDDWQVLWVGGRDVLCVDAADGTLRWRLRGKHLHHYAVGRFDPGSPDLMVYAAEAHEHRGSHLVGADGAVRWSRDLGPGLARTVRSAGPEGEDVLALVHPPAGEASCLLRLSGDRWLDLPLPPVPEMHRSRGVQPDRGGRWGITLYDVDGDGTDEILAHNRKRLVILKVRP